MFEDYGQSSMDSDANTTLNNLLQFASDNADAFVSSTFVTPFSNPVPKKIKSAALYFAAEMCYQRRLSPDEKNPFKELADYWRKELMLINAGQLSLEQAVVKIVPPVLATVTKSRINDSNIY